MRRFRYAGGYTSLTFVTRKSQKEFILLLKSTKRNTECVKNQKFIKNVRGIGRFTLQVSTYKRK